MASIIRIKRSTGTAAPSSLKTGELAYSYGVGSDSNGGDRLYFGKGDNGSGVATSVVRVGGEFYMDKLTSTPGTLTASKAIVVNTEGKIDQLKSGNITITGSSDTISTSSGDLTLNPSGNISANSNRITDLATPVSSSDAATKNYVDGITGGGSVSLNISGEAGSGAITLADSVMSFAGTGLSATVSGETVTYALDSVNTTVGSFGSATQIPVVTVTNTGLVTSVSTVEVNQAIDSAGVTRIAQGSVSVTDVSGDGSLSYDSATGVFTYTGPSASEVRAHFSGGTGVTYTSGTGEIAIGQSVATDAGVTFDSARTTGSITVGTDLTVGGDLTVNGTTTSINTITYSTTDPLIRLADSNVVADVVDIGFVGKYYNSGRVEQTGLFRDASDGKFYLFNGLIDSALDSANVVNRSGTNYTNADLVVGTITADNIGGSYTGFDSDINAAMDTTHFTVTSGAVSANDITITTGSGAAALTIGEGITFAGNSTAGITTASDSNGRVTFSAEAATTTQRGTASFGGYADSAGAPAPGNSRQFTITAGDVSIAIVDGGTYQINSKSRSFYSLTINSLY